MATSSCPTGKRLYLTHELAEEALVHAWSTFHYSAGKGPIAIYQCEDCGYFHFTSKGEMNKKLADLLREGKISKWREASDWERKLRKK